MTTTTIASNIEWKKWGEEDPLYGVSSPIMRMTHYAMADLFDTLPAYGFTGVEISVFPMKSNGDPHPFIFARKAGENGS